jgi:hypothetical protein
VYEHAAEVHRKAGHWKCIEKSVGVYAFGAACHVQISEELETYCALDYCRRSKRNKKACKKATELKMPTAAHYDYFVKGTHGTELLLTGSADGLGWEV